jgi:hypothetical protein
LIGVSIDYIFNYEFFITDDLDYDYKSSFNCFIDLEKINFYWEIRKSLNQLDLSIAKMNSKYINTMLL